MMSGYRALSRKDVAKDHTASTKPHSAPNASETHAMLPRWSCCRKKHSRKGAHQVHAYIRHKHERSHEVLDV